MARPPRSTAGSRGKLLSTRPRLRTFDGSAVRERTQLSTRSTVMCCVGTVKRWPSSPSHQVVRQRASRDAGCCCTRYSLHTLCKTGCVSTRRSASRCAACGSRGGRFRNREASLASHITRHSLFSSLSPPCHSGTCPIRNSQWRGLKRPSDSACRSLLWRRAPQARPWQTGTPQGPDAPTPFLHR